MNDLWKKWTVHCALGELIGIGCAGLIAFIVNLLIGEPMSIGSKILVLLSMLFAGFIEGYVLAHFQWHVLVKKFTDLPKKEWIYYTVMVAVLGWLLGMLPSLFMIPETTANDAAQSEPPYSNPFIFALLSIGMGLALGALFGSFQWFSLKKYARKAHFWIIANALGWGLGLGWIYLFASIPDDIYNFGWDMWWNSGRIECRSCHGIFSGKTHPSKNRKELKNKLKSRWIFQKPPLYLPFIIDLVPISIIFYDSIPIF